MLEQIETKTMRDWDTTVAALGAFRKEINRVYHNMDTGLPRRNSGSSSGPQINIADDGANLVFTARTPGMKLSDLDINISNNAVLLAGKRKQSFPDDFSCKHKDKKAFVLYRRLALPVRIDPKKSKTVLKNGLLELTLTKVDASSKLDSGALGNSIKKDSRKNRFYISTFRNRMSRTFRNLRLPFGSDETPVMTGALDVDRLSRRDLVSPRMTIAESKNALRIEFDAPGAEPLNTFVYRESKNLLTIYVRNQRRSAEHSLLMEEFTHNDWYKMIALPDNIDMKKNRATVKRGVLTIHLPKSFQINSPAMPVQVEA